MQLESVREWIPDHVLHAPELLSKIEAISQNISLDPDFIHDITTVLGLNELVWFSPYLKNGSTEPAWEPPTDSMGEFSYLLGWLTSDRYLPILKNWAQEDQFFKKLYKVSEYFASQSSFSNSSVNANYRTHTNLQSEFFGSVSRGSAPFLELFCQTGTRNCRDGYPNLLLWIFERAYQNYIRSGRSVVCSKHQLELMGILRNLSSNRSNQAWGFLSKNLPGLKSEVPYLEFRNRLDPTWFNASELLEGSEFENSRRVQRICRTIDVLKSEALIYLSPTHSALQSKQVPTELVQLLEISTEIASEEESAELDDADLNDTYPHSKDPPSSRGENQKKKSRTEQHCIDNYNKLLDLISKDSATPDRSRLWQRSIEQSVWFFANPYFNDKIETFVTDLMRNAKFDDSHKQKLITHKAATEDGIVLLNAMTWLRVITSQSLVDVLKTRSDHHVSERWSFNTDLTHLRRLRPQFGLNSTLQLEDDDPRIETKQLERLPHFVIEILRPFVGQLYPLIALISDESVGDRVSPSKEEETQKNGSTEKGEPSEFMNNKESIVARTASTVLKADPISVRSRNVSRNLKTLKTLFRKQCEILEIDLGSWPEHSLRILHNKQTRNLTEGQLLHSKPNELKDAACAYYQVVDSKGKSTAGSRLCPSLNDLKNDITLLKAHLRQKVQSDDLIVSWNATVDLVLLYLYVGTGVRPLQDPWAEINTFDLSLKLAIIDDKQLPTRDSARVIPLPNEIVHILTSTYLPSLSKLADRIEDPRLRESIRRLAQLKGGKHQDIPFFFHLDESGLTPIGESWIQAHDVRIKLAPNFHRHAISNFLEVKDRELIDFLLGHQHLQVPVHGLGSLRTPKHDLCTLRTALSVHLRNLGLDSLPKIELPEHGIYRGSHIPKIYGIEKRRRDRTYRIKKKIQLINEIVDVINLEPIETRTEAAKQKLHQIRQSDEFQGYLDIVIPYFAQGLQKVEATALTLESNRRFDEPNPINVSWLKALKRKISISDDIAELLNQAHQFRSGADLGLLLSVSLITNNGITDPEMLSRVLSQEFAVFHLQNNVYLEFSFDQKVDPVFAATRRHRLTRVSTEILIRFENKRTKHRVNRKTSQMPSEALRKRLLDIGLHGKSSCSIINELIKLEKASQIYELPMSLCAIASGEIPHRSVDRASLVALTTQEKISAIGVAGKQRYIGKKTADQMAESIHQILKVSRSLVDTPEQLIKALGKLTPRTHPSVRLTPISGLIEYVCDMFNRKHNGRSLAGSTKEKYLLKLQRILLSTDLAVLIMQGDSDAISEEIHEFLERTAQCGKESHEYSRHIRGLLDTEAIKDLDLKVSVPHIDPVFNPRVTLYSRGEVESLSKKLVAGGHLPALSLLHLYAHYGLRTQEATLVATSRIHFCDNRSTRIYVRGNSSKRLKTSSSNRIATGASSHNAIVDHFQQQVHVKKSSVGTADFFDGLFEEHQEHLDRAIKRYIGRGQTYCLRHYFANEILWPAFLEALDLGLSPNESVLGKLNGAPINSHTLYFAGRLLGHASPRTTLTHYFHRGFDVIDLIYAKRQQLNVLYPRAHTLFNPWMEVNPTGNVKAERLAQRNTFQLCADYIHSLVSDRPIRTSGLHMMEGTAVQDIMLRVSSLSKEFRLDFKGGKKQEAGIILNPRFLEHLNNRTPPSGALVREMKKLTPDLFLDSWTNDKLFVVSKKTIDQDLAVLSIIVRNLGLSLSDLRFFTKSDSPSDSLSEALIKKNISVRDEPTRHTHVYRLDGQRVAEAAAFVDVKDSVKVSRPPGDQLFSVNRSVLFAESIVCAMVCAMSNSLMI